MRFGLSLLATAAIVVVLCAWPQPVRAQQAAVGDTLRLGALQGAAVRHDPRAAQLELLATQSALRQRSLGAERLPALSVLGQAQYQSVVFSIPVQMAGVSIPVPPHDTYNAYLDARQSLYDPSLGARRHLERAQLAQSQAQLRTTLFALRQSVNDAYFTAVRMQAQGAELEAGITDLQAQLRVARERVQAGAALESEAAMLEATLLTRRQSIAELDANRTAALVVLGELTGRTVTPADVLALPALGAEAERARSAIGALRERPEYEQFTRSREVLARQRATITAQEKPRVSAFGRTGYERAVLNPLDRNFQHYWLGGVQVEWAPWSWGTTDRQREALMLQQQIVRSEEAAFTEQLRRSLAQDLATIDRLERALDADDAIIELRERILRETSVRYAEGVITSAEYVDRETDLLAARLARVTHRVELAQARAHFLTSVGIEVR